MRVVALLTVRNEALYMERCLTHLYEQDIETCVIDNESTDQTRRIAESFRGRGVFRIETMAYTGHFDLAAQLRQQQDLAQNIDAHWFIHHDADEIMEAPAAWPSMLAAITDIDARGFNAINFDEFVFPPVESESFEGRDYVALMRQYYFFEPAPKRLVRAWKKSPFPFQLADSGGHSAVAEGRKLFPENFILRHYIGLSLAQLKAQYIGRVFSADELERGWHRNRVPTTQEFVRIPPGDQLTDLDQDGWRTDRKCASHLIFNQPEPYVPPKRIAADRSRPAMPFVVGVARSGTTLLRLLLDAHPDLAMTPETGWLGGALQALQPGAPEGQFRKALTNAPNWGDMEMSDDTLDEILVRPVSSPGDKLRAIYWAYAARFGAKRVGDKTPLHGGRMVEILEFLPEARFIHIIRDGRDVASSLRDLWFGPGPDAEAAAVFWMWHIREMRQQAQFIPHYMEVRFEELVTDTERVLRAVGAFIDLPFHADQLHAHERASSRLAELKDVQWPNRLITAEQRKGLFKLASVPPSDSRIGVWRREMSLEDQAKFTKIAGDMLTQLGYPT